MQLLGGGFGDDILVSAAGLIADVLVDPALPEVIQLATELQAFETGPSGATPGAPGIGLTAAVPYLRFYVYYREHAWVPWLLGLGVLGLPLLAGIAIGRKIGG